MTTATRYVPGAPLPVDCRDAAAVLNLGCVCRSVDHQKLRQALAGGVVGEGGKGGDSLSELLASRPHLFSDTRVYVAEAHLQFMADLIAVIEQVVGIDAWRE